MNSELQSRVVEALQPAATSVADDILFWKPFEKAPVVYYIRFFGELACKINIRSEHDPVLPTAFLGEITAEELAAVSEERPVGLFPSPVLARTRFASRALVPPSISRGALSKPTSFMAAQTYTAFPVYRCEFTDVDTRDEVVFRMAKVVSWSDWSRTPAPALSARFHRLRSGVRSTGGRRMGVFPLNKIEMTMAHLDEEDGFIEIENFERRVVRLEHDEGKWEISQGEERWTSGANGVKAWLHVFAIEGLDAADERRKEFVS